MSAKSFRASILFIALVACTPIESAAPDPQIALQGRLELAKQCEGRDGWSDPAPPAQVFGNVYMVGTCGIVSLLITSQEGHILIDGATAEAAPLIAENIRKLGFEPRDVRYLLSSHEHVDHAGGLAALKQLTGGQMLARAEEKQGLETGVAGSTDPQSGQLSPFTGVRVDRVLADGEQVRLGPLNLTAIATPGHTIGSTSWSWQSCEGKNCRSFVYADSVSAISAEGYRFSEHREYVAMFRSTLSRIAALPNCEILVTPHPGASGFFERLAGSAPLVNTKACASYAAAASERLTKRLTDEAKQ